MWLEQHALKNKCKTPDAVAERFTRQTSTTAHAKLRDRKTQQLEARNKCRQRSRVTTECTKLEGTDWEWNHWNLSHGLFIDV